MNENYFMVNERRVPTLVSPEIPVVIAQAVVEETSPPPPTEWAMFAGSLLFVFAGLAAFGSWVLLESSRSAPVTPDHLAANMSGDTARVRVRHFNDTQPAKRGDLIVFEAPSWPQVQPVLATASDTVAVRRGQTIEGLFLMGPQSYVVSSNNRPTVVRAEKIRGTLVSNSTPAP